MLGALLFAHRDTLTTADAIATVELLQRSGFTITDAEGREVDRIEFTDGSLSHWTKD